MSREGPATFRLGTDEADSDGVIRVMAAVNDVDPLALPALYTAIDPDALDALMGSLAENPESRAGSVAFSYNGYTVTVDSHGTIRLASE